LPCVSYYKDIASLLLRLALTAPTQQGPVRSSSQLLGLLDPEVLARLFEGDPERAREAASLRGSQQARAVVGAVSRFANFFHAVGTGFDAAECGWSFGGRPPSSSWSASGMPAARSSCPPIHAHTCTTRPEQVTAP
jgi:hypothetical protein